MSVSLHCILSEVHKGASTVILFSSLSTFRASLLLTLPALALGATLAPSDVDASTLTSRSSLSMRSTEPAAGAPGEGTEGAEGATAAEAAEGSTSDSNAPAPTAEAEATPSGEPEEKPEEKPEGPTEEEDTYTSSKDRGAAISGRDTTEDDGMPQEVEVVGKQKKAPKNLSHLKTGSISAAIGTGYGLITAGDKYCGELSTDPGDSDGRKAPCFGMTPVTLDVTAGFGAAARIDVVLGLRLNLQKREMKGECQSGADDCKGLGVDKNGIGIMPGVRLWGKDNNRVFKIGGAIDFLYMYENFDGYRERPSVPGEDNDPTNEENEEKVGDHVIGLRGGPIIQIDPHHNVGIYFIPAAVPSFRPAVGGHKGAGWFEIGFEGSIGVQARFP